MTEASEVQAAPTAGGIPRADGAGKIAAGWVPDAAKTIKVEESDGSPALTDISTLVFDPGTVANLGGGRARIAGGGGDTINIQGRPVASNAPDLGQALVWTGSTWAPGNVAGGGESDWVYNAQLIGLVDGVNKVFTLSAPAVPSSLTVMVESGGALTVVPFTMPDYTNEALGITPTVNAGAAGGYYGSSPASCLVNGAITGAYWSPAYATPVVTWLFATAKAVARCACYSSTAGGFGGLATYKIERSVDGATWIQVATDIPAGSSFVLPTTNAAIGWRLVGVTKYNGYEWSAIEIQLETAAATVTTVTLATAPAVGAIPRASFRIAPTIDTGGSSGSTALSGAAAVYLFENFI
jgi:hypothetical protein